MANLTISAVCNQHCPYCFTGDHLGGSGSNRRFLEPGDLDARLDFLDRSGMDQARFLGGEPTLHPHFSELVERARARNKKIVIFTNGLMPQESLACLEALPATECQVLVNVNEPAEAREATFERQRATIRRLGERALLGFNVYRADFRPGFLLSLIADSGCKGASAGPGTALPLRGQCLRPPPSIRGDRRKDRALCSRRGRGQCEGRVRLRFRALHVL